MPSTFSELIQFFIKRRNLSVEQLANLANLSRKTLYRWVNGEVVNPRHWYQIVALGKALRLNVEEVNQLLAAKLAALEVPLAHDVERVSAELADRLRREDPAAVIGGAGVEGTCATCVEAVEMFVATYGAYDTAGRTLAYSPSILRAVTLRLL